MVLPPLIKWVARREIPTRTRGLRARATRVGRRRAEARRGSAGRACPGTPTVAWKHRWRDPHGLDGGDHEPVDSREDEGRGDRPLRRPRGPPHVTLCRCPQPEARARSSSGWTRPASASGTRTSARASSSSGERRRFRRSSATTAPGRWSRSGDGVKRFEVGDRVYAYTMKGGFYAEYVAVNEDEVALIPAGARARGGGRAGGRRHHRAARPRRSAAARRAARR